MTLKLLEILCLQQFTCTFSVLACFNTATAFLIWILEHNIDWLVLFAILSALKLLLTNGGFCFSYLFDARKVGVAVCDKLLSPRKRFLQSRGPACPCAKKPCECCEVATWSHFGFFLLLFSSMVEPSVDVKDPSLLSPWGLLGRQALCPRYLGLLGGFGFGFVWGSEAGIRDASCVCSRVSIVLNAHFLGLEWSLVLGKRILPHPRKWEMVSRERGF